MKFLLAFLCLSSLANANETFEFEMKGLTKLTFINTSGRLTLISSPSGKAQVTVDKISFGKNCQLKAEKSDKTLIVEVKGDRCEANFAIRVPSKIDLDLIVGNGTLKTSGTHGELKYKLGNGEIEAQGNFLSVNGTCGNGNISLKGYIASAQLRSGSGNISLILNSVNEYGTINIQTGTGNADLTLPKGSHVQTSFFSGIGHLTDELGNSLDHGKPQLQIIMNSGTGNLNIRKK